jgi:hypothetical protein
VCARGGRNQRFRARIVFGLEPDLISAAAFCFVEFGVSRGDERLEVRNARVVRETEASGDAKLGRELLPIVQLDFLA